MINPLVFVTLMSLYTKAVLSGAPMSEEDRREMTMAHLAFSPAQLATWNDLERSLIGEQDNPPCHNS